MTGPIAGTVTAPVPAGVRITLDPDAKQLTEGIWYGGSPARVLRLTPSGRAAWRELVEGPVVSRAAGVLARRLTDAGIAHPCPTPLDETADVPMDVTVVIPVRDRAAMLDRCLAALGDRYPVLVVDDGSHDPRAVADVARRHRATVLRRQGNGGPAAARNTALASVTSELVAFVDSDCVPDPAWIDRLAGHFADPLVAAVAPRVVPLDDTPAGHSSLDLGDRAARVLPGARVSFVPTAALLARRACLLNVAGPAGVFDPALRVGEDVDLVWRLHEAGWRIRYDPAVRIAHQEPATTAELLSRRFRYGTSAAPLALRHPDAIPPLVLYPWPAVTALALLAGRPAPAAAAFGLGVSAMTEALDKAGVPTRGVSRAQLTAVAQTWLGIGRYSTQFAAVVLVLLAATRSWRCRAAVASLLLGPALTAWARQRPRRHPLRFVIGHLADNIAYGAGVWAGSLHHRTSTALRPRVVWRSAPVTGNSTTARGKADHGR